MTEPKPSADPADYTCRRCHSGPGEPCGVLQGIQLRHPHDARIETMIRAHNSKADRP